MVYDFFSWMEELRFEDYVAGFGAQIDVMVFFKVLRCCFSQPLPSFKKLHDSQNLSDIKNKQKCSLAQYMASLPTNIRV